MSGFFRGPPLTAHVLAVALGVALAGPSLAGWLTAWLDSPALAWLVLGGIPVLYAMLALAWAARHVLFRASARPGSDPGDRRDESAKR